MHQRTFQLCTNSALALRNSKYSDRILSAHSKKTRRRSHPTAGLHAHDGIIRNRRDQVGNLS
jgi:hypothetical protein